MEESIEQFFEDFRQEWLLDAKSRQTFQLEAFVTAVAEELVETGIAEGFEPCHFSAKRGLKVDGYWFDDEGFLDLYVADFEAREKLESLTATEMDAAFNRVKNFYLQSKNKRLYQSLDETTPEYDISRQIADRAASIKRVNFILASERVLSNRINTIPEEQLDGIPASFNVWDIPRLFRQKSSRGAKEPLNIELEEVSGSSLPALEASSIDGKYRSFLIAVPASLLAKLYEKYGARLLEQNVRCFLQARGKVNKGIRRTILKEPEMFFAYNNGITATAETITGKRGAVAFEITGIEDLQIVNGGQTTASLFHTWKKDGADLSKISVQMKLTEIPREAGEEVVPNISEYANTQNRVSAADFFSNHPYHIRVEEMSRRIWAPATAGEQRETKWFYERARGQFADAQASLTPGEKKRFLLEYPKSQKFTKTDLAKYENVWDEHPKWVNLGAQKNFGQFAMRIGQEWENDSEKFNELYYQRLVARAIIFKTAEKVVSGADWYEGGYRANLVAYSLASIGEMLNFDGRVVDFHAVWQSQKIGEQFSTVISIAAQNASNVLLAPPSGVNNISEWAKKPGCWDAVIKTLPDLAKHLSEPLRNISITLNAKMENEKQAKKVQKLDDGIACQREVLNIPAREWAKMLSIANESKNCTEKEIGILSVASQIPKKLPTEKQSIILLRLRNRFHDDALI